MKEIKPDLSKRDFSSEAMIRAGERAELEARRIAKAYGQTIVKWKDGKVVYIEP